MSGWLLVRLNLMYNGRLAEVLGDGYSNGWLNSFNKFGSDFFFAIRSTFWDTFFDFKLYKTYNTVLWTMERELWGSMFCFAIYGILGRITKRWYFYLVLVIITIKLELFWLCSFIIGYSLADYDFLIKKKIKLNNIELILKNRTIPIILMFLLLMQGQLLLDYWNIEKHFISLILAIGIILLVLKFRILFNTFSNSVFIWLGKISFSLYLIHMAIICSFTSRFYLNLHFSYLVNVLVCCISTLILSIVFSFIFYKYIDRNSVIISEKIAVFLLTKSNNN